MAGTYYNTVYLHNFAAQNPFTVGSGGLISVVNGYGIVGTAGYAWTLFNRGTIKSSSNFGVELHAGGLVVNGQSGSSAGLISGLGRGVRIDQTSGTVINYGSIVAHSGSGVVLYGTGSNTVVNLGSIDGNLRLYGSTSTTTNSGTMGGLYVNSSVSGAVTNSGVITAGVSLLAGDALTNSPSGRIIGEVLALGASIVNYGTITGSGVALQFNAALVNGGTITGLGTGYGTGLGTAVSFGSGTELLAIKPGAVFNGVLSGLTVTDTIDLVGVKADSAVFSGTTAGGTLSVMNGTAVVESLVLAGRFANNFAVAPDGQGGVDVTIRQPTGNVIGGTYTNTIVLSNPGITTITSTGRITAASGDGVVNAAGSAGSLINMGRVTATGSGGQGIYLGSGGFVTNSVAGAAGGYISGAGVGVMIGGGAGTVTNSGTIAGGKGVAAASGVNLTVTNAGTITGTAGTAVSLGGGTNRLIVGSGAVFSGKVDGGGGSSVLEITAAAGLGSSASSGALGAASTAAYVSLGSAVNFTSLQVDSSATLDGSGALNFATLVNQGQINVASGDSLALGNVASAATTGVIDLRTGGTVDFEGAVASQTLEFNPSGGTAAIVQPAAFSGTIADFTASVDTIDLTGLAFAGNAAVGFNSATDVLTVTEGGASATLQLDAENYTGITWSAKQDAGSGTEITANPCFCRGTLIRTETGDVPVEELAIGDRVMTISGMARPVKWIGRRSYSGRFALGQTQILPVCVRAGALDDGVPRRDLWVSPNHALYLEGVLIEAHDLVNGMSVFQAERVAAIEYFHIELDSHDVLIAEGVEAESFIDDDSRGLFHNAHEYRALYPDMAAGPARYCAPRRDQGYEVERARAAIARRAGLAVPVEVPSLGPLRGQIERTGRRRIAGWAQDAANPEAPVCLDILAGGELIGQVVANTYRADLAAAGLGSFRHGFEFVPPAGLAFAPRSIAVRRSLDGAALTNAAHAPRRARAAAK